MATRWMRLIGCLCLAAPASAAPPIQAYGHLPSVDDVVLSPDGANLAVIVSGEQAREIQIRKTADLTPVATIPAGMAKVRSLQWAGTDHLLITTSTAASVMGLTGGKREYFMVVDFNLPKRKMKQLLNGGDIKDALNTIVDRPTPMMINGKQSVFLSGISFPGSRGVATLYRQTLDGSDVRQVALGNENTREWLVDDQGKVAARVDYEDQKGIWSLWTSKDGHMVRSHMETAPTDTPSLIGYGRDKQTLLVANSDGDKTQYHEVRLGEDHWSDPITDLADSSAIEDPTTRMTIGASRQGEVGVRYSLFDASDQKIWQMISRAFPQDIVRLKSWSSDRAWIVLKVEGPRGGAAYYLLNSRTKHAEWIADEYAGIGPDDIAPVQALSYQAQDGLRIPAYLTLPRGSASKGLPLVVLVHGGPAARDDLGFDWWSQALASRGYAVLQPQFRGSTGFGQSFMIAGFGEWGRKMQTDVSDGVRYLAQQGTIDPKRVCIVGGSYGGYAALAGVTIENSIYHCAVSLAGPSDLRRMMVYEQSLHGGSRNDTVRYWQQFMGAKSPGDPALDAISPYRLADRVKVPVLLIHGVDDTVVPFDQSRIMADALTKAGKKVQFVRLQGEDHWLSRSATRMQMLQAVSDFLDVNLPVTSALPGGGKAIATH